MALERTGVNSEGALDALAQTSSPSTSTVFPSASLSIGIKSRLAIAVALELLKINHFSQETVSKSNLILNTNLSDMEFEIALIPAACGIVNFLPGSFLRNNPNFPRILH